MGQVMKGMQFLWEEKGFRFRFLYPHTLSVPQSHLEGLIEKSNWT